MPSPRATRALVLAQVLAAALAATELSAQNDSFSLEGLIVTTSPTPRGEDAVPTHVTVLDGDALRSQGIETVEAALRRAAGLHVVQNGSFGAVTSLFMRGAESDHVLVLVDGVQLNQPGGAFDFASLTTDNVERIEIVRGPGSAVYGSDAVAGVVHVITRIGRGSPRGSVSARTGSFGRRDWSADFQAGTPRAGYALSFARRSTDGVSAFNNGHVNTGFSGRGRFRPDGVTDIDLSLRISQRQYNFPTDATGNVVDRNAFTFADATVAAIEVGRRLSDRLLVEARLGLNDRDQGTDDAPDGPADTLGFYGFTSLDHLRRGSAELRAHLHGEHAVLTAGVELEEERVRSFNESASEFGVLAGRSHSERSNVGVFAHGSAKRGGIDLTTGGRLEENERFGRIATWQAGVSWSVPRTDTRVRLSIGRGIKEPTFFENFATGFAVGNPDLRPERSLAWELGADRRLLGDALHLRATYFHQRFEDLIQYTSSPPSPSDPSFFNVAAANARGVELSAELELAGFGGGLSWTWLDSEVVDAGFEEGPGATFVAGDPLLRRPRHTLLANLAAPVGGRVRLDSRARVVGTRGDRDFGSFPATPVQLPRHVVVAVGGAVSVREAVGSRPGITVTLRAENLLDERYEEVVGFRAPGRALYVGASVTFGGG